MSEKQLRITNILLSLILLILTINLIIDLMPLIITGRILSSFSRSTDATPFISFYSETRASGEGTFIITNPTQPSLDFYKVNP